MGSKRNIIDFVSTSINDNLANNQRIYDIFGGSGIVSAAFRNITHVTCNDIQSYTKVLAETYLQNYHWEEFPNNNLNSLRADITYLYKKFKKLNHFEFNYSNNLSFERTKELEDLQRNLRNQEFSDELDHLFSKNYSGTFWSYNQCVYIDVISSLARNKYKNTFLYNIIMSSLMFAMSYTSQSTGHYAQFRELTEENLRDILAYRNKSLLDLFLQKFLSLKEYYDGSNNSPFNHLATTLSFEDILDQLEENSLVYADPPYQFVHYSRFYHALETLVRYDYPELKHKGRYRDDRHQSPFCVKTKVEDAFRTIFRKVFASNCTLILSYSNTGMISIDRVLEIGRAILLNYQVDVKAIEYKHSTMGRQSDKYRDVLEAIIVFRL